MTDQTSPPMNRRERFASWHREPSLYREIYARTVATLIAAGVVYLIAVASGYVSERPAQVALVIVIVAGVVALLSAWGSMVSEYLETRDAATRKIHNERASRVVSVSIRVIFSAAFFLLAPFVATAVIQLLN